MNISIISVFIVLCCGCGEAGLTGHVVL